MKQLEEVFTRLSPLAFSVSLKILHSRQNAEDVVQDVFMIAVANILKKKPGINWEELGRFIVTACKNKSIDVYRRERKSVELSELPGRHGRSETEDLDLKNSLDKLEPKYKEVLILKHIWGMTWNEVAKKLGLSNQGARKRGSGALNEIKKKMGSTDTENG